MPDRDILILMSTHNGERHIADQLGSLQNQSVADRVHILIRDDGSTDSTVDLLRSRPIEPASIEVVTGESLGARDSFATLMNLAGDTYRVIMLCDQDDVWLPDKVEIAAEAIRNTPSTTPVLYCGRSTLTDSNLTPRGLTNDAPQGPSLRHAIFQNIAPGHTMAFNQALLNVARQTMNPDAIMHDWWLYCLSAGLGTVIFDPIPHALYRIHSDNEIGYSTTLVERATDRVRRLFIEDRSIITRQATALDKAIGPRLTTSDQQMLANFLDQARLSSRMRFLLDWGMPTQTTRWPLGSSLLYALGRYR